MVNFEQNCFFPCHHGKEQQVFIGLACSLTSPIHTDSHYNQPATCSVHGLKYRLTPALPVGAVYFCTFFYLIDNNAGAPFCLLRLPC